MLIEVTDLPQPVLEFGDDASAFDPRIGLARSGPFSVRFGKAHQSQIRLGIVGSSTMLELARDWFTRCQGRLYTGKPDNPMYVDFPGFENAFQCSLDLSRRWEKDITEDIEKALGLDGLERFEAMLEFYAQGVERLADEFRPDVVVCCLPPEVVRTCRVVSRPFRAEAPQIMRQKRKGDSAQLSFAEQWEVEDTSEDLLQRDFRRALKAKVMRLKMPIQIATMGLLADEQANQDPATRAWNSNVALFYKAGGIPWRVRSRGPETCYIGISFHYLKTTQRQIVYSSLAQAFSSEGDGFALRGDAVPPMPSQGRHAHLHESQAVQLAHDVIKEYRERTGQNPARVVLHKTTQFDESERSGFSKALAHIPVVEFVNIAPSDFRLVQRSAYPPKRGTLCRVNGSANYLFTTGFIPEWNTYPGVHVPAPVEIVCDRDSDVSLISSEVLALARMNWNTAFDTTGAPITLRFARQVGGIMSEVGAGTTPHPSYRFYM